MVLCTLMMNAKLCQKWYRQNRRSAEWIQKTN